MGGGGGGNTQIESIYSKIVIFHKSLTVFMNEYEERAKRESYMVISQAYRLYDVLWVLALALNDTITMIDRGDDISRTGCDRVSGSLVPFEEFDYSNKKMGCLIQWNIQQTDFYGLTVSNRVEVPYIKPIVFIITRELGDINRR